MLGTGPRVLCIPSFVHFSGIQRRKARIPALKGVPASRESDLQIITTDMVIIETDALVRGKSLPEGVALAPEKGGSLIGETEEKWCFALFTPHSGLERQGPWT